MLPSLFDKTDKSFAGKFTSSRTDKSIKYSEEVSYLKLHVDRWMSKKENLSEDQINIDSLKSCLMESARTGLSMSPHSNHAYPIPRWDKNLKQFIFSYDIGYRGIIHKALQSGRIKQIDTEIVYEKDLYERWTDESGKHFRFIPKRADRGNPQFVICNAIFGDGGSHLEEMNMDEIRACEKASESGFMWKGPWKTQMWIKSCIRRASKRWPPDPEVERIERELSRINPMYFDKHDPSIIEGNQELVSDSDIQKLVAHAESLDVPPAWVNRTVEAMGILKLNDLTIDQIPDVMERMTKRAKAIAAKGAAVDK